MAACGKGSVKVSITIVNDFLGEYIRLVANLKIRVFAPPQAGQTHRFY